MKKINWLAIKKMLFTYLAVSKILYWISIIPVDFESVGGVIWQRLIEQDLVVIAVIVITYFFDKNVKKQNGVLAHIMFFFGNYVIYIVTLIIYIMILSSIIPTPVNLWRIMTSSFMLNWTVIFFILMVAVEAKERFKKKEAQEYALDVQCADIKLGMLKTLLEDGALTPEEFDIQKMKL